jgi:chromosome segregation ATPase
VDTLAIQRSLVILEDRYRELREIGEKHRQTWEAKEASLRGDLAVLMAEKEGLERELVEVRGEKEGLERELVEVRGEKEGLERDASDLHAESELFLIQLHQVQDDLEYYFLENQRKDEKLHWLLGQRQALQRMLRLQARFQRRFMVLDGRIALPSLRRQLMPWWQRLQQS